MGLLKKLIKLKKITLLFLLMVGLSSCSNDSQDKETTPEVSYADVKPTQTKYRAYYGEKLTKLTSIASKNAELGSGLETIKPVSVIYYPRTHTIAFSNIFDNTTVEYAITSADYLNDSTIYSFKVNGVTYTCTITLNDSKAISVVITSANATYSFAISLAETKKLATLLVKDVTVSPNIASNSTREYIYIDTLINASIYRYKDPNTLEDLIRYSNYQYDGAKLKTKETANQDGVVTGLSTFTYANDLIVKATNTNTEGTVTGYTLYEYDSNKRISAIKYANATMVVNLARYYTYPKKNTLNVVYTGLNDKLLETEVCTYDDQRKNFLYSQDQALEPFLFLPITSSVSTTAEGEVYSYPNISYEYSDKGLLVKTVSGNTVKTFEYKKEQ